MIDKQTRKPKIKKTAQALDLASQPRWQDAEELRWAAVHWASRIGAKTQPSIHLRQMSTKWGSVSPAGRLTLNTDLLAIPKPLGEFVIVHELVHLLVPNHGRVFKYFMHAYLPDWEARERDLQRLAATTTPTPSHPPNRGPSVAKRKPQPTRRK